MGSSAFAQLRVKNVGWAVCGGNAIRTLGMLPLRHICHGDGLPVGDAPEEKKEEKEPVPFFMVCKEPDNLAMAVCRDGAGAEGSPNVLTFYYPLLSICPDQEAHCSWPLSPLHDLWRRSHDVSPALAR